MANQKRVFISDNKGGYQTITKDEIVDIAKSYLVKDLKKDFVADASDKVADYLRLAIGDLEHEVFGVMYLDNKHNLIDFEIVATGTVDRAAVYPREILKKVLATNAAAVIFSHNHPSGDTTPSQSDLKLTKCLKAALELIDIRTLDHVIVSNASSYSFAASGDL